MDVLLKDLVYSLRMLVKRPGLTLVAIIAIALGIGANTAIFSVVNTVLLQPLPYDQPQQLVMLATEQRNQPLDGRGTFSYLDLIDLQQRSNTLEYVATYQGSGTMLTGNGDDERVLGAAVSADYFPLLRVKPEFGRVFTRDEDKPGAPAVIVLSHALWQRRFGGDRLDRNVQREMYVSFAQRPERRMNVVVRTEAPNALELTPTLRAQVKAFDQNQIIWRTRTLEELLGQSVAPRRFNMMLLGLFASVALILAAVGLYGVMSYSVSWRVHEIGIRMALGANRSNVLGLVVRQGMTLTLIGLALGLVGAFSLSRVLRSLLFGVTPTDPLTFAGVSAVLIIVALLACLIPARRATRVDPMVALRTE